MSLEGFEAGGNYIKVTFWQRGEYLSAIYTYDVLDLWKSDRYVAEIIDAETGEVLFRK